MNEDTARALRPWRLTRDQLIDAVELPTSGVVLADRSVRDNLLTPSRYGVYAAVAAESAVWVDAPMAGVRIERLSTRSLGDGALGRAATGGVFRGDTDSLAGRPEFREHVRWCTILLSSRL